MKLIHLSDLHIGKRLKEMSLIEDQKYILSQITEIIKNVNPDGVIIAGDIYDKSIPSAEAVALLDEFLTGLSELRMKTFIISGNHDSAERVAFGSGIMETGGIYLSPVYNGEVTKHTLKDEYGEADIYMLPFIRPAEVRRFFPDTEIGNSYTEAVRAALSVCDIDTEKRNIIITHQFVTGASRCDSEDISVGGIDNVDAAVFDRFDYVALGHIHGPQNIGSEKIRYCGTPLKYSFSETEHKKSVTVIAMHEKGNTEVTTIPLKPMRELRKIRGTFTEVTAIKKQVTDYVQITLTDETDIPGAPSKLRDYYPFLLELMYDNSRTRNLGNGIEHDEKAAEKDPFTVFSEFFIKVNSREMNNVQEKLIKELINEIKEEQA